MPNATSPPTPPQNPQIIIKKMLSCYLSKPWNQGKKKKPFKIKIMKNFEKLKASQKPKINQH
jgi:hypothetical protein